MVEPGTEVHTDGWRGYNGLAKLGYQHKVIRETPDLGDNLLPLANRIASLLKRWLLGTHQGAVQSSHLDYYLDEYTFRFNRRTSKSRGLLFYRLITQAVDLGRRGAARGRPVHSSLARADARRVRNGDVVVETFAELDDREHEEDEERQDEHELDERLSVFVLKSVKHRSLPSSCRNFAQVRQSLRP
jgi:hypothetical protein